MTKKTSALQQEWDAITSVATKKYVATKDRMDVEDAIQHVETTVQDIDALIERYVDRPDHISEDEMWNYLEGIKCVLKLRIDGLWDAHRQRECIDGYAPIDEVMRQRFESILTVPDPVPPKKKGKKK
jgi:hypothetical protein